MALQPGQWDYEGGSQVPDGQGATPGTGFSTTGLTRAPDGTWWVANHGLANLADQTYEPSLVHLSADFKTKIAEFSLAGSAIGKVKSIQGVAYDSVDKTVWVGSQSENLLYEIDQTSGKVLKKLAVPFANGVAFDSRYNALWVCSSHSNQIHLINADTGAIIRSVTLSRSDPDHLYVDTKNDLLYYSYGDTGKPGNVGVVSLSTGKDLGVYKLTQADAIEGIYIDGDDLYAANNAYYHDAPSHKNAVLHFELGLYGQKIVALDIALSGGSVKENAAAGTLVGLLSTKSSGATTGFTYSLVDDASGLFALSDGKIVTTTKVLDYEAAHTRDVSVRVTDGAGNSIIEKFTISVLDVDEGGTPAPVTKPVNIVGTSAAETFVGSSGDDRIDGGAGDDIIYGFGGNDTLTSGPGSDKLYGGDGDDRMFAKRGTGPDLFDGGSGIDLVSTDLGKIAKTLTVDLSDPSLLQSLGDGTQIINVEKIAIVGGTANDRFIGGGYDDSLNGYTGDDTLTGAGGNDVIVGGEGLDTVVFSGAHSAYAVSTSASGDAIITDLRAGAFDGVDTVTSVEVYQFADGRFTLAQLLSGAAAPINHAPTSLSISDPVMSLAENSTIGTGMRVANIILIDDGLGANTFVLSGADAGSFAVKTSADGSHGLFYTGASPDYETKSSYSVNIDVSDASVAGSPTLHTSFTLAVADVNEQVEGPGSGPPPLPGVIYGTIGADSLTGGAGDDVFEGGVGADILNGLGGVDTASFASSLSSVKVDMTNAAKNNGDAQGDVFMSIENLLGSAFADSLNGNSSANSINGGRGNDAIAGQGGADILLGADGNDTVSGNGGNDMINGGAGDDVLAGGASGRDWFVYDSKGWGADRITDFEDGVDLLDFRSSGLSFGDLHISQHGADTLIELDATSSILINNLSPAQLGQSDFLF